MGLEKLPSSSNHPEIDRSNYLTINPDDIKEEMAQHGMIPERRASLQWRHRSWFTKSLRILLVKN